MSWFKFTSVEKKYNISINTIAKDLGVNTAFINNLLSNAGYNPLQLSFSKLTDKHLEIILLAYASSLKSYYKKASKDFNKYDLNGQNQLREFFAKFIRKRFFSSYFVLTNSNEFSECIDGRIFKSDLDNDLIRDYFFNRIKQLESFNYRSDYFHESDLGSINSGNSRPPAFIYREMKLRIHINHTFNDIKSRLFTTVITGHYYIFSSEEDSLTALLTSIKRCFLAVVFSLREALKFNNSKLTPNYGTKYTSLY